MTEYEIIDAISDSVNPVLFFVSIVLGIKWLVRKNFKRASIVFGLIFTGLLVVYGASFVDSKFKIWESFASDYSTHTAFAISSCVAISVGIGKRSNKWLMAVFFMYVVAMLYQRYHSVLDIVSTSLVVGVPLLLIRRRCVELIADDSVESST